MYEDDDELNDPEYMDKWNAIFKAVVSFVKLLSERREHEDHTEGDETMGQQSA